MTPSSDASDANRLYTGPMFSVKLAIQKIQRKWTIRHHRIEMSKLKDYRTLNHRHHDFVVWRPGTILNIESSCPFNAGGAKQTLFGHCQCRCSAIDVSNFPFLFSKNKNKNRMIRNNNNNSGQRPAVACTRIKIPNKYYYVLFVAFDGTQRWHRRRPISNGNNMQAHYCTASVESIVHTEFLLCRALQRDHKRLSPIWHTQ